MCCSNCRSHGIGECAPPDEIKGLLPKFAEGALAQGQIAAMLPKYALDPCSSLVLWCRMTLGLSDYLLVGYGACMKPGPWHAGQASQKLWSSNFLVAAMLHVTNARQGLTAASS